MVGRASRDDTAGHEMIPEQIPTREDGHMPFCVWLAKWGLALALGIKLQRMQELFPTRLLIFSGFRTRDQQEELDREGRPAAPFDLSTHTTCPATGADVRPDIAWDTAVAGTFGSAAVSAGLRWGGGGPIDETGIPIDRSHLDLGPRTT